jgi:hypothetical protein
MKRIHNFVKNTFKKLPIDQKEVVIERVTQILTEKVEDLMEQGLSLDEAVDKTVIEFGEPEDFYDAIDPSMARNAKNKNLKHYRNDLLFSALGSVIIIGMLIFTNLTYMEDIIWFVLPSLAVLWWPLALLYRYLNQKAGKTDE